MKKVLCILVSFLLLMSAAFGFQPVSAATLFTDDFEDGNYTGWSRNGGSWSIVTDGTKVYKQSSTSANAYTYAGASTWTDYSVQADIKPLAFNGTDRGIYLCARLKDTSNFYFASLSNSNKLQLGKKSGGGTTYLATKTYTVTAGNWYTVKLALNGSQIDCYINDVLELSASDTTFTAGKIGLYAFYSSAEFDNILIDDSTPASTPTPTPTTTTGPTPTPSPTPTTDPTPTPTPSPTTTTDPTPSPIAGSYYVSPTGSDNNTGSSSAPFYSISKAITVAAAPGSTIYVRGGTYNYDTTISLSQSGTASAKINLLAYPGEKPVLNFSTQIYGAANRAFNLLGDYWYIKGLEICYAGDNGMKIEGSHNTIENCVFHHNGDSGIQLGFAHATENPNGVLCSYNEIINCDSYLNFDFDNAGSDADGFACKMHNGKGNKFVGCRSWHNSDDGWDLFETDWAVEITNCWTWHNGDKADFDAIYLAKMGKTMSSFQGNGNGFKLGGNGTGGSSKGTHIVKNCVSFDNNYRSRKGFDQNSHKGGIILYNCTAFGNGYNYMFEDNADSGAVNEFKNNVSFAPKGSLAYEFASGAVQQNNSWNISCTADDSDFKSLSESLALAQRQSDGSLPLNDFAKLAAGSDLIDKGVNVGLPYKGSAPDLGAFEAN